MNNIPDALAELGAVLGILGIIGAVYSFLKYTSYKTTVSIQNDSATVHTNSVTTSPTFILVEAI